MRRTKYNHWRTIGLPYRISLCRTSAQISRRHTNEPSLLKPPPSVHGSTPYNS